MRVRIGHHRRFTANHTWYVDWCGRSLFLKANPRHGEAMAECLGHERIRGHYPVPQLRGRRRCGPWTMLAYDRWPHIGHDNGLLLDEIAHADLTADTTRLDRCLTDVFARYAIVIGQTLRRVSRLDTIGKLYAERAAPGGRLDAYYKADRPWLASDKETGVRPSRLSDLRIIVNCRHRTVDFPATMTWLRSALTTDHPVWTAITQGDPTDFNIGWSPSGGPVWFDYDTGGRNDLAGEFACFLLYQRLHGAWLTPHNNLAAFRDHPAALEASWRYAPDAWAQRARSALAITYRHVPSPARRRVMGRYLNEIVSPIANHIDVDDLMDWLRPYMVMRLLAVYDLAALKPRDAALSIGLLAEALDPSTTLSELLALKPPKSEVMPPWNVPSPSSPEPARASGLPPRPASPIATT